LFFFRLSFCARLNWQLGCQFFSANHLSYHIVSYRTKHHLPHGMDLSVTCHPDRSTNPTRQASTQVTNPSEMEGWVDLFHVT